MFSAAMRFEEGKMLSHILQKSECAECRFCCAFKRSSQWETPLFDKKTKEVLEKKYPEARFRQSGAELFTVELSHLYKTPDESEEAPCPFLGKNGCTLASDEKPFDCSLWPFRPCRIDGKIKIVLEKTCPAMSRLPLETVKNFVRTELAEKIRAYIEKHPDAAAEFKPEIMTIVG